MNYTEEEILSSARLGFEFEFLSKEDPLIIARSLSDVLGIRVVVPLTVDNIEKEELKYHTPITVTANLFKLEADWSAGKDCKELITGPLPFEEAKIVLLKILNWIDKNAWTTDRTAFQFNVSFDAWKIKMKTNLTHMNALKFCLEFNEDVACKDFPKRKDSIYAKSIKHLLTNNIFNVTPAGGSSQFIVAPTKYYAVNLTKLPLNYLEFRFLGGEDYQTKKHAIIESIEYSIISLYKISQNPELTQNNIAKLSKLLESNKRYLDAYKNYDMFKTNFPDIKLTVDMRNDIETIKSVWSHIHDRVFKFLLRCGCSKMNINYDSDAGKIQVKEANLRYAEVEDVELISCTGFGYFHECYFYDCKMEKIHMDHCTVVKGCIMTNAKVESTNVQKDNELIDSYVANDSGFIVDCKMVGGVFRKGLVGANAELSEETSIVSKTEETAKKIKGTFGVYKTPSKNDYKQAKILKVTKGKGK